MASTTTYSGASGFLLYGASTSITGASGTSTITVTASGHGLSVNDMIKIWGVLGMTDINSQHIVTVSATTFQFALSPATSQTYTSGGTVQRTCSITGWTLNQKCDTREVTDSNSGATSEFIPEGHTQWEGTFEGMLPDGANRPTVGSSYAVVLAMNSSDSFSGTVKITGMNPSLQVKGADAVKVSYTFQGTGTLTETNS
jgi:hypothetical protein